MLASLAQKGPASRAGACAAGVSAAQGERDLLYILGLPVCEPQVGNTATGRA